MKLFWCPRTRSSRALWALEEVGKPYERVLINILGEGRNDPAFRKASAIGKVPAFEDGGVGFGDSTAICAYLADKYPEAELAPAPGDPMRGKYLQWLLFTGINYEPGVIFKMTGAEVDQSTAGWGRLEDNNALLDKTLQEGPWLLGEKFTMADVLVGGTLHFGRGAGFAPPLDSVNAYIDRCEARPAFQRAVKIEQDEGASIPAPSA